MGYRCCCWRFRYLAWRGLPAAPGFRGFLLVEWNHLRCPGRRLPVCVQIIKRYVDGEGSTDHPRTASPKQAPSFFPKSTCNGLVATTKKMVRRHPAGAMSSGLLQNTLVGIGSSNWGQLGGGGGGLRGVFRRCRRRHDPSSCQAPWDPTEGREDHEIDHFPQQQTSRFLRHGMQVHVH